VTDETLVAATDRTLVQPGAGAEPNATFAPRTSIRVLPEIVREGDSVQLVPREQHRYEIVGRLGRGGMGEVSLADDHDIGRKIAVKRLVGEQSPHVVARFIDEVRTVGRMEHPNIVPVHDVGIDGEGRFFFVMKYVEGETLSSVIERLARGDEDAHRRFGVEQRLDIFVGVLNALEYAHGRGVLHRDIKPENVMIGPHGEVMLTDWGIARPIGAPDLEPPADAGPPASTPAQTRASAETQDGAVIGTPMYMSPEQARGATTELDARSDLYSAFVLLFELLTLRHVLGECRNVMEILVKVQEMPCPDAEDPVYLHPHQPAVRVELRHYLRRGLRKAPADRFASCAEALAELARVRSGDMPVECPITFMKQRHFRLERYMDAHPARAVWIAGSAAAVLMGCVVGFVALLIARLL
jgi:eukaryotic-like serine/threonine-protein kinase